MVLYDMERNNKCITTSRGPARSNPRLIEHKKDAKYNAQTNTLLMRTLNTKKKQPKMVSNIIQNAKS